MNHVERRGMSIRDGYRCYWFSVWDDVLGRPIRLYYRIEPIEPKVAPEVLKSKLDAEGKAAFGERLSFAKARAEAIMRAKAEYFISEKEIAAMIAKELNGKIKDSKEYKEFLENVKKQAKMGIEETRKAYFELNGRGIDHETAEKYAKFYEKMGKNFRSFLTKEMEAKAIADAEFVAETNRKFNSSINDADLREFKASGGKFHNKSFFEAANAFVNGILDLLFPPRLHGNHGPYIETRMTPADLRNSFKGLARGYLGIAEFIAAAALGTVIDQIMDLLYDKIMIVVRKINERNKIIEEILAYTIFCGVSVDDVLSVSKFTMNDMTDLSVVLFSRLCGTAIEGTAVGNNDFRELIDATIRNNHYSFLADIKKDPSATTAITLNNIKNSNMCLYKSTVAAKGSNCIVEVAYNVNTETLFVQFNDKRRSVYMYAMVPPKVAVGFMKVPANAESIGRYFNYNIRPNYRVFKKFKTKVVEKAVKGATKKKLEDPSDVARVNRIRDEQTHLYLDKSQWRNKQLLRALMKAYGACSVWIDSNGKVHFVYR